MKRIVPAILFIFVLSSTCYAAQNNFTTTVSRYFARSVVANVQYKDGAGSIQFKIDDDYFGNGDKINKICAIESARLFRSVPELNKLKITIPLSTNTRQHKRGLYSLSISRDRIEQYYRILFTPDLVQQSWRDRFIKYYDDKKQRKQFAHRFVKFEN